MIGTFYQPKLVVVDLDTLQTLPKNEFRAGLAEVIKYGIIADEKLFAFLENNTKEIISLNRDCLEYIIETSCAIKAKVVEKDERESRHRMILNFGHTFGHSIETLTNYTEYLHGEALAIGMIQAAWLSVETGECSKDVPIRITNLLKKFNLPVHSPNLKSEDVISSMYHDKKTTHNKLRFILVKNIGSVEIVDDIPELLVKAALKKNIRPA